MKTYQVEVYPNGTKYWFLYDKRHREDGPAVEFSDGAKVWYLNGERHREDGPAVEFPGGYKEWWLNGERLSKEEFNNRMFPSSCSGKIVEYDGKKYKLVKIED